MVFHFFGGLLYCYQIHYGWPHDPMTPWPPTCTVSDVASAAQMENPGHDRREAQAAGHVQGGLPRVREHLHRKSMGFWHVLTNWGKHLNRKPMTHLTHWPSKLNGFSSDFPTKSNETPLEGRFDGWVFPQHPILRLLFALEDQSHSNWIPRHMMPPTTLPKTERHQASTKAIKRQSKKTEKKQKTWKWYSSKHRKSSKNKLNNVFWCQPSDPSLGDVTSSCAGVRPSSNAMAISGWEYCRAVIRGVTPGRAGKVGQKPGKNREVMSKRNMVLDVHQQKSEKHREWLWHQKEGFPNTNWTSKETQIFRVHPKKIGRGCRLPWCSVVELQHPARLLQPELGRESVGTHPGGSDGEKIHVDPYLDPIHVNDLNHQKIWIFRDQRALIMVIPMVIPWSSHPSLWEVAVLAGIVPGSARCHWLRFILKHRPKQKGPRNSHGILSECLMNGKSMHPQIVASITFASCSRPMFFVWFHTPPMENCNFQTNPISSMRKPGKLRQVTRASHHFPLPSPVHPGCCRAEKLRWPSPEWSRMVQNLWFSLWR